MSDWAIVDTSEDKVVSKFVADRIHYETTRNGLAFVVGLSGDNGKGTVVVIAPLSANKHIRLSTQGEH